MQYDLVLEGGGAKSLTFAGALQEFEAQGHTLGRLLGTSAGAITAALLACGYTSQEALSVIYDPATQRVSFADALTPSPTLAARALRQGAVRTLLRSHDIAGLPDILEEQVETFLYNTLTSLPALQTFLSFVDRGYWYADDGFLAWLETVLDRGTFRGRPRRFSHMTLEDFFQATEVEFSLLASDVTDARILILNHRTAPDCPLRWALRMAGGLPFLWPEVTWQPAWGAYLGQDLSGHSIVDGELFSSFPIELFFSNLAQVTDIVGEKRSSYVLGFLIDETIPVPDAPPMQQNPILVALAALPPIQRLTHLFEATLQARDKLTIEAVERHIVRLPAKGYHQLEFQMPPSRFEALVQAGRKAAQRYFRQQATDSTLPDHRFPASQTAIQYINESARQHLIHIGVLNEYHIQTGGGAFIAGNVDTGGGDFVGRDQSQTDA